MQQIQMQTDLVEWMIWADDRVLAAITAGVPEPAEVERLYRHIISAELNWLARSAGQPLAVPIWPQWDRAELTARVAASAAGYRTLVQTTNANEWQQVISYQNSAGERFHNSLRDILLHVTSHGAYHRGQIARIIGRAGGTPPPTDYIVYLRTRD